MNNPQVAKYIWKLRDRDSQVRAQAAFELRETGGASAVPALIGALRDRDNNVREYAAEALGRIGDGSAAPALIERLKDEYWRVRMAAIRALGRIGDASAVPALIATLNDADNRFREYAAEALGSIGHTSAVPALIEALKDKGYVRSSAASALDKIGNSDSLPRKILRHATFSAQERTDMLDALRRVRYKDKDMSLRYVFPDTRTLCQTVIEEGDAEAQDGARAVLNWLAGGRILVRASQPHETTAPNELLRAAQGGPSESQSETLVRGADEPQQTTRRTPRRRTLWDLLFRKKNDETV